MSAPTPLYVRRTSRELVLRWFIVLQGRPRASIGSEVTRRENVAPGARRFDCRMAANAQEIAVMINPDGRLWVDRFGTENTASDEVLIPVDDERISHWGARHVDRKSNSARLALRRHYPRPESASNTFSLPGDHTAQVRSRKIAVAACRLDGYETVAIRSADIAEGLASRDSAPCGEGNCWRHSTRSCSDMAICNRSHFSKRWFRIRRIVRPPGQS